MAFATTPTPGAPVSSAEWHETVEIHLVHDRTAAATARLATRKILGGRLGWDEEYTYRALLVVSELVSNAVLHARPPVLLRLERFPTPDARLRILVRDGGADPAAHTIGHHEERGRGLIVVTTLSRKGGVDDGTGRDGMTSRWAELGPPSDPGRTGGREGWMTT